MDDNETSGNQPVQSQKEKKAKKKNKVMSWSQFLQPSSTTSSTYNPETEKTDWAEIMRQVDDEDDEEEKQRRYGQYKRVVQNSLKLPSAPKASRDFELEKNIPTEPPFKCYIGNLSYELTEADIHAFFSKLKVLKIELPTEGGKYKGFGYVEFETRNELIEALRQNEQPLKNRKVRVDLATSQGGRGGDRGYGDRSGGFGRRDDEERVLPDNWRRGQDDRGYNRQQMNGYQYDNRQGRYQDRRRDDGYYSNYQRSGRDQRGYDRRSDRRDDRYRDGGGYDSYNRGRDTGQNRQGGYESYAGGRRDDHLTSTHGTAEATEVRAADQDAKPAPQERRRLQLIPRTKPREEDEAQAAASSAIFGGAKPVDTAAKEREIEEKLMKERAVEVAQDTGKDVSGTSSGNVTPGPMSPSAHTVASGPGTKRPDGYSPRSSTTSLRSGNSPHAGGSADQPALGPNLADYPESRHRQDSSTAPHEAAPVDAESTDQPSQDTEASHDYSNRPTEGSYADDKRRYDVDDDRRGARESSQYDSYDDRRGPYYERSYDESRSRGYRGGYDSYRQPYHQQQHPQDSYHDRRRYDDQSRSAGGRYRDSRGSRPAASDYDQYGYDRRRHGQEQRRDVRYESRDHQGYDNYSTGGGSHQDRYGERRYYDNYDDRRYAGSGHDTYAVARDYRDYEDGGPDAHTETRDYVERSRDAPRMTTLGKSHQQYSTEGSVEQARKGDLDEQAEADSAHVSSSTVSQYDPPDPMTTAMDEADDRHPERFVPAPPPSVNVWDQRKQKLQQTTHEGYPVSDRADGRYDQGYYDRHPRGGGGGYRQSYRGSGAPRAEPRDGPRRFQERDRRDEREFGAETDQTTSQLPSQSTAERDDPYDRRPRMPQQPQVDALEPCTVDDVQYDSQHAGSAKYVPAPPPPQNAWFRSKASSNISEVREESDVPARTEQMKEMSILVREDDHERSSSPYQPVSTSNVVTVDNATQMQPGEPTGREKKTFVPVGTRGFVPAQPPSTNIWELRKQQKAAETQHHHPPPQQFSEAASAENRPQEEQTGFEQAVDETVDLPSESQQPASQLESRQDYPDNQAYLVEHTPVDSGLTYGADEDRDTNIEPRHDHNDQLGEQDRDYGGGYPPNQTRESHGGRPPTRNPPPGFAQQRHDYPDDTIPSMSDGPQLERQRSWPSRSRRGRDGRFRRPYRGNRGFGDRSSFDRDGERNGRISPRYNRRYSNEDDRQDNIDASDDTGRGGYRSRPRGYRGSYGPPRGPRYSSRGQSRGPYRGGPRLSRGGGGGGGGYPPPYHQQPRGPAYPLHPMADGTVQQRPVSPDPEELNMPKAETDTYQDFRDMNKYALLESGGGCDEGDEVSDGEYGDAMEYDPSEQGHFDRHHADMAYVDNYANAYDEHDRNAESYAPGGEETSAGITCSTADPSASPNFSTQSSLPASTDAPIHVSHADSSSRVIEPPSDQEKME